MQPFGIPKNPKMTVQTRKHPPVHRYPVPGGIAQPKVSNPSQITQIKSKEPPFAEDNIKIPSEGTHLNQHFSGFEDRGENLFETPGEFTNNDLHTNNRGQSLEETPAGFFKEYNIDESMQEDVSAQEIRNLSNELGRSEAPPMREDTKSKHFAQSLPASSNTQTRLQGKFESPVKRAIGTKDDDEYVRMASADEDEEGQEHEEGTEIENRASNIIGSNQKAKNLNKTDSQYFKQSQEAKSDTFGRYREDIGRSLSGKKNPNGNESEDSNLLLKLKRIDLELTKEKKKAEFLEFEQEKLINENAELRKKTEELNARADLMKRYDYSERFARKEEENEKLKLEVHRLRDENRIMDVHTQRILQENFEYKQESERLINSLQDEKRRLQEELQLLRREIDGWTSTKTERITERNQILESQLVELRQQVNMLTNQLAARTQTQQKISDVSEGIQSLVSSFSNMTIHTQTQPTPLLTQESQTSPSQLPTRDIKKNTIDTQTRELVHVSQLSQTSPTKLQAQGRPQASIEVQTYTQPFIQTATQTHSGLLNSQVSQTSPTQVHFQNVSVSPYKAEALVHLEKVVHTDDLQAHHVQKEEEGSPNTLGGDSQVVIKDGEIEQGFGFRHHEKSTYLDQNYEDFNLAKAIETPGQGSNPISELMEPHISDLNVESKHMDQVQGEHKPLASKPPMTSSYPIGGPPKYKVPVSHMPKKPVIGFKPSLHHAQPFPHDKGQVIDTSQKNDNILPTNLHTNSQEHTFDVNEQNQNIQEPLIANKEEITQPLPKQEPIDPSLIENSTSIVHTQAPIHSEIQEKDPYFDKNTKELSLPTSIEEPPRSLSNSIKTTGKGSLGPIANRPPLYNVHHNKSKVHKIGKNPFSNETYDDATNLFDSNAVSEPHHEQLNQVDLSQSHEAAISNQQQSDIKDTTNNFYHTDPKGQSEESATEAENFFDNLAQNLNKKYQDQQNVTPFRNQATIFQQQPGMWSQNEGIQQSFGESETHDLTKSFQSDVSSQNTTVRKSQGLQTLTGRAIPVKKMKGALPSNMFN